MEGSYFGSRRRWGAGELMARLILCTGALLLLAVAPSARAQPFGSFYAAVNSSADLTILKAAIDAAGLTEALSDPTLTYTVFAPTNGAFNAAVDALASSIPLLLAQPPEYLQSLVLYHALPTVLESANVSTEPTAVTTVAGPGPGPLTVQRNGSAITVTARGSTASVIAANVMAAGAGVVHVVDAVLLPFYATLTQAVTSNPELSYLAAVMDRGYFTEAFSNAGFAKTLLAPSNTAFARAFEELNMDPGQLLDDVGREGSDVFLGLLLRERYLSSDIPTEPIQVATHGDYRWRHLTAQATSSGVTFWSKYSNTTVVEADIPVGLGPRSVVHVVDRALLPYYRTVLDFTATRTDLNIFVQAIVSEGTYASVVTGETPFNGTIFVPNDSAFRAFLNTLGLTAEELLADKDTLKRVLETHIVPGEALAFRPSLSQVHFVTPYTTINGQTLDGYWYYEYDYPRVQSLDFSSSANVLVQEGTPRISIMVIDAVLLPGTPSNSPPPGYGGYGGYGYGGYGPYGSAPPSYGGYGGY